ncbi:hypothetical protein CBR_g67162, partial [Chara braunii]
MEKGERLEKEPEENYAQLEDEKWACNDHHIAHGDAKQAHGDHDEDEDDDGGKSRMIDKEGGAGEHGCDGWMIRCRRTREDTEDNGGCGSLGGGPRQQEEKRDEDEEEEEEKEEKEDEKEEVKCIQ